MQIIRNKFVIMRNNRKEILTCKQYKADQFVSVKANDSYEIKTYKTFNAAQRFCDSVSKHWIGNYEIVPARVTIEV